MEFFFIILVSLSLCFLLKLLIFPSNPTKNLPPGPSKISLFSNFIFGRKSFSELGPIISSLRKKYGPLITINLGSQPTIYITNNSLAHKALVQNGAVFADRPQSINNLIVSNSKKIISKSSYGPVWRALRRNLTAGVLHPSQLRAFSTIRKRVLDNLINGLEKESNGGNKTVFVEEYFRHAIFSLLILLCFGENVDENQIKEVEVAQLKLFKNFHRFKLFIFFPRIGKFVFKKVWTELTGIVTGYDDVIRPLIQARTKEISENSTKDDECTNFYVDTLLNLQVPGEEGNITENDIVGLCNEFVSAGTDTTMIALLWIMANVVKYPEIQEKILEDIKNAIGDEKKSISEEDLNKMPYVKAVVLEGLRRHPPGYAPATPHAVIEDVEFGGYSIPKGTAINFLIADIGRDPKIWENPMEFQPERFMKSDDVRSFDVTGNREIKMMPFGAGRRVCPGYGLAMLHMEYLVANLVRNFQWSKVDGEEVDLTEKFDLTISMKNPLGVRLFPRV
ncbi:cytochrome P450 89A2-like [Euphorbia lathyris]|uniref:cytochrome P450 89A2-like n=1 Tax=Euphorbia lathyris TaxID=212925 RepID=UPI003313A2F9